MRNRSQLKKECDRLFSILIRLRDTNNQGRGKCISCPTILSYSEMQCCHFEVRSNMTLRYDKENCNGGCNRCNVELNGNKNEYEKALIKKGVDIDELKKLGKSNILLMTYELDELRQEFSKLCKEFLKDKEFNVMI